MAAQNFWYDDNEGCYKARTTAGIAGVVAAAGTTSAYPPIGLGTKLVCFEDAGYYEYDGANFLRLG